MELKSSRHIFKKYPNIKFLKNPFGGSGVVPCGQTDRQTDMTKIVDAFRNFPNAPNNSVFYLHVAILCFVCLVDQQRLFLYIA